MNEISIIQFITETFENVQVDEANGDSFFIYGDNHKFPIATLVTKNDYDLVSDLDRPGIFRLNIGVSKKTFAELFPPSASSNAEPFDYAALNQLFPHPVYGSMYWVCILNPTDQTFHSLVKPLLEEAHAMAVNKHSKSSSQESP